MELTILMPCLNEAETIAVCIRKAKRFLTENEVDGEILVSDNGSTDRSREIALEEGARVTVTEERGYGNALIHGTKEARGRYIIMGDADDSYDFLDLMPILEKLREGYGFVMGNRFAGGIEKGAMPFSHRYIGNPVLSFLGRVMFKSTVRDFHCGLRGYDREVFLDLGLQTTEMEYASEMVVMAQLNHLKIAEVPVTLKKDGRSGKPHLRSFPDGWRHLKFLLMYAPNWLFLYPAAFFLVVGAILGAVLLVHDITLGDVTFSIHTLLYCMCSIVVGLHIYSMYLIVRACSSAHRTVPPDQRNRAAHISENRIILTGTVLTLAGAAMSICALFAWKQTGFGDMDPERIMRIVIPAVTLLEIGIQNICTGFLIGIVRIRDTYKKAADEIK